MMTVQALRERNRQLAQRHAQLERAIARVRSVKDDAAAEVARLERANEGYMRLVRRAAERARELADIETDYLRTRRPAARVTVFNLEVMLDPFHADVTAFGKRAADPPDAVTAFLNRTGGVALNLSTLEELTIQQLDEARQARFRDELRGAQPADVRDRYVVASEADDDESQSFGRLVERAYLKGWRGAALESAEQIEAAKDLQRRIQTSRELRVPIEVDHALQAIEAARLLVRRAQDPKLHDLQPANPDHDPAIAAAWAIEEPELLAPAS